MPRPKEPVAMTLRLSPEVYEAANAEAARRRMGGQKVGEGASIAGVIADAVLAQFGAEAAREAGG